MKKGIQWIFTALMLAMCLTMPLGMFLAGEASAGANEQLAPVPRLQNAQGDYNLRVLAEGADWFADRFFPRRQLISASNYLTAALFGQSGAEKVICGTEGWLYYAPTLADFCGTQPLTEREQFCILRNVTLMAQECQRQGRQFVFCVAPNKNSVYPQFMPDYGVRAEAGNGKMILEALAREGVACADLFAAFDEQEEILYFAHDTHWNSKGAALGADVILSAFQMKSAYFSGDFSKTESHSGDLYAMLYPAFADDETNPVYGGPLDFTYTSGATKPDSVTLRTAGGGEKTLLAYRDSFGALLYPYLAPCFGEACFSRSGTYDLTQPVDCVLVEIVERNLRELMRRVPLMPAPECTLDLPKSSGRLALSPMAGKAPEGLQGYRGTLPEHVDAHSPVYLVCGEQVYEAFCLENHGFAAYLDASQAVTGLAYYTGGVLTLLDIP